MNLNDHWALYNYILNNAPLKCDIKNCDCHIKAKHSYDNSKLMTSIFFAALESGYRLDKKSFNDFWINLSKIY